MCFTKQRTCSSLLQSALFLLSFFLILTHSLVKEPSVAAKGNNKKFFLQRKIWSSKSTSTAFQFSQFVLAVVFADLHKVKVKGEMWLNVCVEKAFCLSTTTCDFVYLFSNLHTFAQWSIDPLVIIFADCVLFIAKQEYQHYLLNIFLICLTT